MKINIRVSLALCIVSYKFLKSKFILYTFFLFFGELILDAPSIHFCICANRETIFYFIKISLNRQCINFNGPDKKFIDLPHILS